jgi:hypothetical protein
VGSGNREGGRGEEPSTAQLPNSPIPTGRPVLCSDGVPLIRPNVALF